jgi:transglutaminase-like putative cysteine protease
MPLTMMIIAIVSSVLPIITGVPMAGPLSLLVGLLVRWRFKQPVALTLRLVPAFISVFGTYLQLHTLKGLEAGVAVLLGMTSAKLIEARTPRDMQLLALLGWFLCLCSLSIDQAIGHSLWAYAMFFVIATALIRFRRGSLGMKPPLRVCFTMLAQALPFVVLLFFLFPRDSMGIAQHLNRALVNRTGMSDKLDPGSVASIARSQEVAFRAVFEASSSPPINTRYWRCIVMTLCNGMHWERGSTLSDQPRKPAKKEALVEQTITLSPHGGRWLPAYDRPVKVRSQNNEHMIFTDDDTLQSQTEVTSVRRYKVTSSLDTDYHGLRYDHLMANTQVPDKVSDKVRALAKSLESAGDSTAIVNRALEWFREGGFQYTLEPGEYAKGRELDQFLFERRLGFCEHYAASFALLMRLAHVPSRVVIGYLGGEFRSDYYVIRQSDAHAWAEVWINGKGWQRVDPTAVLAPQRITADLRSMMEAGAANVFGTNRNSWLGRTFDVAQQTWEHANYFWYERVVQFDEQEQFDLWMRLGFMRMPIHVLASGVIFLFGLPLLLLWLWLRRSARHPDPAAREWLGFCARLAHDGVKREPHEGPMAFANRAAARLPAKATTIHAVTQHYLACRYGDHATALEAMRQAVRAT